jgi:hypothetical protein
MKLRLLLLLLCLLPGLNGSSQKHAGFRFSIPEDNNLTIPFDYSQNLIVIPVRINHSQSMKFVLDTGISSTIITELTGVDTLLLNFARQVKVAGLGTGNAIEAYFSPGNRLIIDHPDGLGRGIIQDSTDIYVLASDQFELSKQLGIQVNGLIGSDLFNDFIVEIDPIEKKLTFHNRDEVKNDRLFRKYTGIPVNMSGGKAYADVTLVQEDGAVIRTRLLIDTGASLSLWVSPRADPAIRIPEKTVRSLLGQGLNGLISGVNGRVAQIRFGPYTFRKPLVSFPDSSSVSGLLLNNERHGSLGNDILRRFTLILDYRAGMIWLKPNKWFNSPFSYNRSGMEVEKPFPTVPVYTIYNVIENSPAEKAGLKTGDMIESINFLPAFNLSLDDIYQILHGEEGKNVYLRINREGISKKIKFRLEGKI